MTLETVKASITRLTPSAFTDLSRWFYTEADRRRAASHSDAGAAEVISTLRDAGTIDAPTGDGGEVADWVNPGTIHTNMYLLGDVVSHGGRVWRSEHRGLNSWEPGAPGVDARIWMEVVEGDEGEPEDGVIDFLAGYPVNPGDVVRFEGALYEVIQGHTMADHWTPDVTPSLFKAV